MGRKVIHCCNFPHIFAEVPKRNQFSHIYLLTYVPLFFSGG